MKFTIVTVCWNAKSVIVSTIESVLNQDFADFEYLIIDGGSTDGTLSLIKEYENSFQKKRIPYRWISEKDKGVYDAMNKGAVNARGDYILYMNAGDKFFDYGVMRNFLNATTNIIADAYYGNTMMHFYEGSGVYAETEGSKLNPTMPFIHQSVIVRKELLIKHPFDVSFKVCADHEFFHWMREQQFVFQYCNFIVADYDAKEGFSENNPLTIQYELDKIYGRDKKSTYWFRRFVLRCTVGLIQPIKDIFPRVLLNKYFRAKKKYIKWVD